MNFCVETLAFLHTHGLDVEPKGLNSTLQTAIEALQSLYYAEPGQEGLTASELEVARSGGLDPTPVVGTHPDPLLVGVVAYASLLQTGLTTIEAAKALGVSDARIRQRLHDRTLLALRDGRTWKLPMFQFAEGAELPGWGEVAKELPRDVSPVALERWLLLPNPDLVAGEDETPMSPRVWLQEGRPAQTVASLAGELS